MFYMCRHEHRSTYANLHFKTAGYHIVIIQRGYTNISGVFSLFPRSILRNRKRKWAEIRPQSMNRPPICDRIDAKQLKQSSRKQVRRVRVKVPARIWTCDRVLFRSGPVPAVLTTVTLDYSFDNVQILFYDFVFGVQFGVP